MKKAPVKSSETGKNNSLPKENELKKNFIIKPAVIYFIVLLNSS